MAERDHGEDMLERPSNIDYAILSNAIGYQLRRAQLSVFQDFNQTFAEENLRPADFSTLVIIAANPGLKQSEVAEALGIQRANFVAIADGLESRGLAERRKSDLDRRVQALYLTKSGEALFEAIMTKWKRHEDSLIDRLGGAAARDQLLDLLSRIVD